MRVKLYVPDIECDSCIKLIEKKFKHLQGIESTKFGSDFVIVQFDTSLINLNNIKSAIKNLGYRCSENPFDRKNLKERVKHFKENKKKYSVEINAFKYAIYLFLILAGIELVAYLGFLKSIPLPNNFWIWVIYLNISVATLGAAIWHFLTYNEKITCMLGMMVAMTLGMQSGMMIGIIIGATNGFFIGSMVGMLLGVALGGFAGKCCGIMGVIEGMMAGLMGGTMGPMIAIMMISDNLMIFMPFYMAINVAILLGFSYMLFEEIVEGKEEVKRRKIDFSTLASFSLIVTFILIVIILYGPKSALVAF
jgi:cation transport ATPase